jgi:hypothetical protein|tara:strand:+ start:89 stop:190 length:102 start_codon:yes stop_codon:yes gene_type:complete
MQWIGILVVGMYLGFCLGVVTVWLFKKEFSEDE